MHCSSKTHSLSTKKINRRVQTDHAPAGAPTITVFLPQSLRKSLKDKPDRRLLWGWSFAASPQGDKLVIVVAGIISSRPTQLHNVESIPEVEGCKAGVVGSCTARESKKTDEEDADEPHAQQGSVHISLNLSTEKTSKSLDAARPPNITQIRAPIACSSLQTCAINVIQYSTPQAERMKYLSTERISLPRASSAEILDRDLPDGVAKNAALQSALHSLVRLDPLRHQELTSQYTPGKGPGEGFRRAILLLNHCSYLNGSIITHPTNGHHKPLLQTRRLDRLWSCLLVLATVAYSFGHGARAALRTSIIGVAPVTVSATALQLDLRLGQLTLWPGLGYRLRSQRRRDQEPVMNLAPRYIALYNGVWLVLNDLILGQAAGKLLCDNCEAIASFLSRWSSYLLVENVITTLNWLDDWPAGVKLNLQLSRFFRDVYVGLAGMWGTGILSAVVSDQQKSFSGVIYGIGLSSRIFGLTMLISLVVDFLRLTAIHITICYRIQQTIFHFFGSSIVSLFQLFRGKKRNPLRGNRIDQATYELDQLLLGTIFFTLLVFLWLTVAVYYFYFGLLRLGLVGAVTVLQTALAFLNHLPLFALMLRIKEPDRLPAGVELQVVTIASQENPLRCSYYKLCNVPLDIHGIFQGYDDHLQALRSLPRLLWRLLVGRPF